MSDRDRDSSFFTSIKEKVDLEDYLTKHLNVELVSAGTGRMQALCPFHEEDTPSFSMNDEGDRPWKTWHCFGACAEGGTVLDAVIKGEDTVTDVFEAAEFLNELYNLGLETNSEAYKRFRKTIEETRAHAEKAQEEIGTESRVAKQAKQYLHNRGYSDETILHFGLGLDLSTTNAGRLSIPIYDKAGQPVSVANRALFDKFPCRACKTDVTAREMVKRRFQDQKAKNKGEASPFDNWKSCPHCGAPDSEAKVAWLTGQDPKYLFIKDFDKARYLYNENNARPALLKASGESEIIGLFLVEGYPDAWAGSQSGHTSICAYSGSVLSDEQAKEAVDLAQKSGKPIVLVPDFDETGQGRLHSGSGVDANIRKLNAVDPTVEVQVVHGIDHLIYEVDGKSKPAKDLGEVLQHFGDEKVDAVLRENRWPAGEWRIRQIIEATNPKTGEQFHSKVKEMEFVATILRSIQTRESLDHLIPELAEHWKIREEQARNFFYSNLSATDQTSAQHLFKDIEQAQEESAKFLADANVIPLGFEDLDKCFPGGGVRPGQLLLLLGKSGTGKALPANAALLAPSGWVRMGEIKVGDELIDPSTGGVCNVVGVYPQGERDIFKITFSDGTSTECDGEHLWQVELTSRRPRTCTTLEIREKIAVAEGKKRDFGRALFIPLTAPVEFAEQTQPLPLDPYLLGAWIGDGSARGRGVRFTTADTEMAEYVGAALPDGVSLRHDPSPSAPCEYTIVRDHGLPVNAMRRALVELGLAGKRSEDKFIPEAYKWASPSDRLEMLRGLMDTDGSAQVQYKEGREIPARTLEFCSVSSQLAEDVAFLVRSLGGVAKIKRSSAGYRKDGVYKRCLDRYRVRVSFAADINPFRLQRKAEQCIRKSPPRRRIVSIEPAGRAECQCITVDSPSKLYMTNDFIVTHNTMLASQMLANMADREVNCLFLSLEQGAGSFYPRLACQALDMPVEDVEEFIKTGAPELEKVHQLYKNMLLVDNVPTETTEAVTMTPGKVQSIIQEANLTHFEGRPIDVVIIDHLGILEVGADAPGDIMKSETAAPGWIMKELFKVCKSTRVFMIVLQQLPKQVPAGVPFAYDAGWGGSAQTNFSDYVLQIWRPEQAEGLDDTARLEVEGQYKIALGKNRYGPGALGHYFFDKTTLRILPPLRINQPKATGLDGDEEIMFFSPENEMPVDGGESFRPSEAGATEASLQALVAATPDIVPRDNQALLDALGAVEDEEDSLDDVFGEAGLGEDLSD